MAYIGPAPASSIIATSDIEDGAVTSAKIAASVAIAKGGTGTTTAAGAFTALAAAQATVGDGSAGAPAITSSTASADSGIYFPAADTIGMVSGGTELFRFGSNPIPGGEKNLVQNGAMTVNQRGSTAVAADNTFAIDRYSNRLIGGGPARWTVTQDTTVPSGEGFGYSYKVDVTTVDSSISTDDYHAITHTIEAQNLQHLNFNNAASESLTLTFWARAKKAGLHGGAIYNNDANRSLVFSWTAVADTWQKVTVPVPAETSAGTINNDNGAGLTIYWSLSGGKFTASNTGAWVAGASLSVTSAVNDLDSTSNDFYLTGVQLEIGNVATDFAHEDVGTTLLKCQRYFYRVLSGNPFPVCVTAFNTSTTCFGMVDLPVTMRAAPTLSVSNVGHFSVQTDGGAKLCSGFAFNILTQNIVEITMTTATATAGIAGFAESTNSSATMDIGSEL
jgi:hypothetical protein